MTEQALAFEPQTVSDLEIAFPGSVRRLMPDYAAIPVVFKKWDNPYCKLVSKWFFEGLTGNEFQAKPGIDKQKAIRHLQCILGSFEPKHEHKEAAVAYLMSLWFDLPGDA